MKIAFFSSGTFGLPVLEELKKENHEIVLITKVDAPSGRGLKLQPSPSAVVAEALQIPIVKVNSLKSDFIEWYFSQGFDVAIVVDFGFYIPKQLFQADEPVMVNIHPSLLPKYRGPNPIRRAICSGELETGVTLIKISEKMDEGDIYLQERVPIDPDDDYVSLTPKLQHVSMELLKKFFLELKHGNLRAFPQLGDPSYAPKFTPDELWIDWQKPAHDIQNQVRALADVGAKTTLASKLVKIFKVRVSGMEDSLPPGHYVAEKESLYVGTGQGSLEILSLQLEGRKKRDAASFVKGLREKEGVFGG